MSFEPQSPAAKATRSWYGWQTLSADALSIGLIALGGALESQATAIAGVASLHLASPLIHFVHGRSDAGWLSAGGRVASTALLVGGGALVMEEAFDDSEDQHGSTKETAGAIMATIGLCGMAAMIALDATFAVDRHAPSDRPTAHLQLIPWMTRDSQGATMQVSLQM